MILPLIFSKIYTAYSYLLEEHPQWIHWVPVAIGFGIILYFTRMEEPFRYFGLISSVGFAVFWYIKKDNLAYHLLFGFLFFLSLGFCAAQIRTVSVGTVMLRAAEPIQILEGVLKKIETMPSGLRLTIALVKKDYLPVNSMTVRINFKGRLGSIDTPLQIGDHLSFKAALL